MKRLKTLLLFGILVPLLSISVIAMDKQGEDLTHQQDAFFSNLNFDHLNGSDHPPTEDQPIVSVDEGLFVFSSAEADSKPFDFSNDEVGIDDFSFHSLPDTAFQHLSTTEDIFVFQDPFSSQEQNVINQDNSLHKACRKQEDLPIVKSLLKKGYHMPHEYFS